jgi:hypothetical protein
MGYTAILCFACSARFPADGDRAIGSTEALVGFDPPIYASFADPTMLLRVSV